MRRLEHDGSPPIAFLLSASHDDVVQYVPRVRHTPGG